MAELVLSTAGEALGAQLPGALSSIGAALGRAGGAYLGRSIDQQLFGASQHYRGARLTDLHIQGSTEGASIPAVYGTVRIAGQVIWAARFKEHSSTRSVGGKGGPTAKSTSYSYSLSFAVGLCEGEIARIGRVWANGAAFDLSQYTWRLHTGGETQAIDPLIEAIEGGADAPAYRGLAYIVFEDLPLEAFGNALPQLSFEMVRPAPSMDDGPRFEERVKGVCLIPGAGEFVYASELVLRNIGPGQQAAENVHLERNRANLVVSLDQLGADFPNCDFVMLVVAWFGDDLRCGVCAIKPAVEIAHKDTTSMTWRVNGVDRAHAHLVSQHDGAPAFGGTPADASVLQAIAELKARGYKVGLCPFLLMDVPAGNALADPYGASAQAAYPWRGRVTVHPAAGQVGSPDKTSAAAAQIASFFGAAAVSDFGASGDLPMYSGPSEWSYRRFILHHAKLAALAGGVDAFLIGSELRGVTTARDGAANYPAVAALKTLAADVRGMLGSSTKLTYAADWSEYFGHQPQDGSHDVFFHLDSLWADANIDAVGVDWYPPLSDWRDGDTHADASLARSVHGSAYLEGRIEAGEDFDFFYASVADRAAQTRTAITDGAYAEPWVFRAKDIRNFWRRQHFDRPSGVRSGTPTAWAPQSKPIWFTEIGCPAVDKGANAPNRFIDDKSAESALPYFSSGARDDAGLSGLGEVVADLCWRASVTADVSALTGAVSGYVVDAPSTPRDALEPLMAAYDFAATEHEGDIVFFHRSAHAPTMLAIEDAAAESYASQFAQRGDAADAPIEARVRFLDSQRDYLIGAVSARRLDRAEGGVASIDAPLVLEVEAAERLAGSILADRRASAETVRLSLGSQHLALEPGDQIAIADGDEAFEITRIDDAETRKVDLKRLRTVSDAQLALVAPNAPASPPTAPTPALSVLDLPLLPGAEDDERPLAAVFASPWVGDLEVAAGASAELASKRATISRVATMGELTWALWPGPVDRWDEGNATRVKLYGGALASASEDAVLSGANAFAIAADGEWEIVQACDCVLVGDNEYELSKFLRGCVGSAHAMQAPHPVGARVVVLNDQLTRLDIGAHEWREAVQVIAPPFGLLPTDARAASASVTPPHAAARPWAPAHVRGVRGASGDVAVSWIRCARTGGDSWGPGDVPLGENAEAYQLDILSGSVVKRSVTVTSPAYAYSVANQIADFGGMPASLHVRVAQLDSGGAPGLNTELTITL
ncbi:MAG: glycoside hydrolase/phage tail family protein [Proteobacteria bacterium]|nr:glycoside hydrolase/phage tail family protein [Pseudomonadota bacterium]